jgi:lipid-A-disaccharide synthase
MNATYTPDRVSSAPGSPSPRRLLVSCGEPSGDLYAGELVRHLRERAGPLRVFGLGGDQLLEQVARLVAHVRDLAIVGLVEVLRHLRRLRSVFRSLLREVDREPVALAVLVDYAGFNLRLARELRRRGIPVVYYVSPQVWAWRRGRVRTIRECVARMLVIFPFEEAFYARESVPVTFVGHPLVDLVRRPDDARAFLAAHGLEPARPVLAVLPGSRRQELARNLPPIAGALRILLSERPDLQPALALAPGLDETSVRGPLEGLALKVIPGGAHALMGVADAGIIASGTATVEAALLDLPSVVVYRVSPISYVLGRPFVSVPHYAMVNLIAQRRLLPELMQGDFEPPAVAREVRRLLEDASYRAAMKAGLADVRAALGQPGASARAADVVMSFLR